MQLGRGLVGWLRNLRMSWWTNRQLDSYLMTKHIQDIQIMRTIETLANKLNCLIDVKWRYFFSMQNCVLNRTGWSRLSRSPAASTIRISATYSVSAMENSFGSSAEVHAISRTIRQKQRVVNAILATPALRVFIGPTVYIAPFINKYRNIIILPCLWCCIECLWRPQQHCIYVDYFTSLQEILLYFIIKYW